jgi:hypothetical protein
MPQNTYNVIYTESDKLFRSFYVEEPIVFKSKQPNPVSDVGAISFLYVR